MRAAVLLLLVAAACATAPPRTIEVDPYDLEASDVSRAAEGRDPELPDAAGFRAGFRTPIMRGCDELSCWYDLPRLFRVRAVRCHVEPHYGERAARCVYERQLVRRGEPPGPWRPADSLLMRHQPRLGGGWFVVRDYTRDED